MLKIVLLLGVLAAPTTYGLSCYGCSKGDYDGEKGKRFVGNCYTTDNTTIKRTCPNETDVYCRTKFKFQDGIPTNVIRDCAYGSTDHDQSTALMPLSNKCTATINSGRNPVDTTHCYYHCKSENCNDVSISTVKPCNSDCSRPIKQGFCNYISGECVCESGYEGPDCSSRQNTTWDKTPPRKCVQCNSATERGCETKTEGADCPGGQRYCSSVVTKILTGVKVERTITTRACISSHVAADRCEFTDIYHDHGIRDSGYTEYTCYSTCGKDNCNTNTPNGTFDKKLKPRLRCYDCSSSSGDCKGDDKICDDGYDYCTSTVTYFLLDIQDRKDTVSDSSYQFHSLKRSCGMSALSNKCTITKVGDFGFNNVTCEASCQKDKCNTGWPNRPKCLQCSGNEQSGCLKKPGVATSCSHPYHKYCYIKENGLVKETKNSSDDSPKHIERGCSYKDMDNGCTTISLADKSNKTCNYTCSTDGCNFGSPTVHASTNFSHRFYVVVLAWISAKMLWY